jgi:hypothetical protein
LVRSGDIRLKKDLNLSMNKYPVIPHPLRSIPSVNLAAETIPVDLARLYHHYYLDAYGRSPPNPDPAQFEYTQFLLSTPDFRFQGHGLGDSPAAKRNRSNELGQAFCRWFLYEHFNITYFAHIAKILNRQAHHAFGGLAVKRAKQGDVPDYFCAESANLVYLAEAKGRYKSISFKNKEFDKWRKQFDRVVITDAKGVPVEIKGHIVATRFVTEADSQRLMTGIFAEDPSSPGVRPIGADASGPLVAAIISLHYGVIAEKLRQPYLAVSLTNGVPIPNELRIQAVAWDVISGPLTGRRFVGGYFPGPDGEPLQREVNGRIYMQRHNPLRLDSPSATFFGLEESIFRSVVAMARSEAALAAQIEHFTDTEFFYSGFSALRDGSAIGPLEFFSPAELITL